MKASNSPTFSPFAALTLKLVGVILIVSSLLDYLVLLYPLNIQERGWQLAVTTQLVDRGVIPMVGVAFLVTGYAIANSLSTPQTEPKVWQDLRLWALSLSSLLGLIFLLLVPIHLNNISYASDQAIAQISERSQQLETQVQNQSQQVIALLKDEQKLTELDQAIKGGKVKGNQLTQLQAIQAQIQKLKQNPKALDEEIEKAQTKIRNEKLKAETQARREATKSVVRTGLSSLLLSIGYLAIGALGLVRMGGIKGGRRKTSAS